MDFKLNSEKARAWFDLLREQFDIYAPRRFEGQGRHSYTDSIRYARVEQPEEIVFDEKSHFSPKEVLLPINHTVSVSLNGQELPLPGIEKDILLFLRPCDRWAIAELDSHYQADSYYRQRRDRTRFVLMECNPSWDTCFCTACGTNRSEEYSLGVLFRKDVLYVKAKDGQFIPGLRALGQETSFDMPYVRKNVQQVRKPHLESWDLQTLNKVDGLPLWQAYQKRCIGCGACNMACPSCTCMHTVSVKAGDTQGLTETRRYTAGCQVVKTEQLKQAELPELVSRRMKHRVMDKFYACSPVPGLAQKCVGCGRCIAACPRYISFANTVNLFHDVLEEIYTETGMDFGEEAGNESGY